MFSYTEHVRIVNGDKDGGLSPPQVRKWLDDGKLEFRKVGTHYRICVSSSRAFLNAERAQHALILAELAEFQNEVGLV